MYVRVCILLDFFCFMFSRKLDISDGFDFLKIDPSVLLETFGFPHFKVYFAEVY